MNQSFSRRQFFKSSVGATLAASTLGAVAAVEPFKRAGAPHLKLSMCAYSLRDYFGDKHGADKKIDMFRFIDYCAEQGCDGAELTSYYFPKQGFTDEWRANYKRYMHTHGIAASGASVANDFTVPEDKIPEEISKVKSWTDRAAFLGAPYLRVFAGMSKNNNPEAATKSCIAALKECCAYAGKKGVMLGLENHHGIVATSDQIINIVQSVDSPWLGINCDTANFQTEDPYADLTKIAPYAINVHFKGEIHPKGHEKEKVPADLPRLVKILREANYHGYLALEYESAEDPWFGIPKLMTELKSLIRG